jgi:hypothetical protein
MKIEKYQRKFSEETKNLQSYIKPTPKKVLFKIVHNEKNIKPEKLDNMLKKLGLESAGGESWKGGKFRTVFKGKITPEIAKKN